MKLAAYFTERAGFLMLHFHLIGLHASESINSSLHSPYLSLGLGCSFFCRKLFGAQIGLSRLGGLGVW